MRHDGFRLALLVGTALTLIPAAASAQTEAIAQQAAPAAAATVELDEVLVTARRREERLQDVPLAVTALSGASLAEANITDVYSVATRVPSLTVQPGNGAGRSVPIFAIRGLSQQELGMVADPSISVYLGEVVAPRAYGLNSACSTSGRWRC